MTFCRNFVYIQVNKFTMYSKHKQLWISWIVKNTLGPWFYIHDWIPKDSKGAYKFCNPRQQLFEGRITLSPG